jgi:hypothetical protein
MTIVGVVENEIQESDLGAPYQPMVYLDYLQLPKGSLERTPQHKLRSMAALVQDCGRNLDLALVVITWWTRYFLIHYVALVLFATAPFKASRSATWARWFSSGKPIVMRAQLAYGGCARPISMRCESIAAASFGCGIPASKKMKFAFGCVC